jgi:hypothetical protein
VDTSNSVLFWRTPLFVVFFFSFKRALASITIWKDGSTVSSIYLAIASFEDYLVRDFDVVQDLNSYHMDLHNNNVITVIWHLEVVPSWSRLCPRQWFENLLIPIVRMRYWR